MGPHRVAASIANAHVGGICTCVATQRANRSSCTPNRRTDCSADAAAARERRRRIPPADYTIRFGFGIQRTDLPPVDVRAVEQLRRRALVLQCAQQAPLSEYLTSSSAVAQRSAPADGLPDATARRTDGRDE